MTFLHKFIKDKASGTILSSTFKVRIFFFFDKHIMSNKARLWFRPLYIPSIGRVDEEDSNLDLTLSKCSHYGGFVLDLVLALNASTNTEAKCMRTCAYDLGWGTTGLNL